MKLDFSSFHIKKPTPDLLRTFKDKSTLSTIGKRSRLMSLDLGAEDKTQ